MDFNTEKSPSWQIDPNYILTVTLSQQYKESKNCMQKKLRVLTKSYGLGKEIKGTKE